MLLTSKMDKFELFFRVEKFQRCAGVAARRWFQTCNKERKRLACSEWAGEVLANAKATETIALLVLRLQLTQSFRRLHL